MVGCIVGGKCIMQALTLPLQAGLGPAEWEAHTSRSNVMSPTQVHAQEAFQQPLHPQKDSGNGDADLNGEEVKKAAIPATGSVPGFVWKDYLPSLFQALREAFGIDNG